MDPSVPQSGYPVPHLHRTSQTDNSALSQYYVLATGTIFFYDYLLTLADEVCRYFSPDLLKSFAEITFYWRSNMSGVKGNRGVRPPLVTGVIPLIFGQHFGSSFL